MPKLAHLVSTIHLEYGVSRCKFTNILGGALEPSVTNYKVSIKKMMNIGYPSIAAQVTKFFQTKN